MSENGGENRLFNEDILCDLFKVAFSMGMTINRERKVIDAHLYPARYTNYILAEGWGSEGGYSRELT